LGQSSDYPNVPNWTAKPEGYQTGAMVKYQGNIFKAAFWASEPGASDPAHNGWRLYDELYDLTSHPTTAPLRIVAYIPTWSSDLDVTNATIYKNITHGLVAFLMFSETTPGAFDSVTVQEVERLLPTVVSRSHLSGAKIGISIGGATDYGFLALMQRAGANPNDPSVQQAVANVVQFVKTNRLDHVDLDLECWWDRNGDASKDQGGRLSSAGPHPAGLGLTAFAKQLKQALPAGSTLSATLFATSWYGNNYDAKIADQVDWLAVMTYDLTGSWNASPVGPHTALTTIRQQDAYAAEQQGTWPGNGPVNNPILSVEESLWYWTNPFYTNWQGVGQKVARSKILLGVPVYGYDFAYAKGPDPESGQIPPGYKVLPYKDIVSQFAGAATAANANFRVAGISPRPSFVGAAGGYQYAHNIYFETAQSAVAKLSFAKNVGASGVIVWDVSCDVLDAGGTSILGSLYSSSGNPQRPPINPVTTTNWMREIPGATPLYAISIPGTHDTCSSFVPGITGGPFVEPFVQCQDLSLEVQLLYGLRYIDIRCRLTGNSFAIHHGSFFLNQMFGTDVRDVCVNFLKANPSECIIMSINKEYTDDNNNTQSFEATFNGYMTGFEDFWYLGGTTPTLDEVRGKIVLLRRFAVDQSGETKGIDASVGWQDNASSSLNNNQLYVQDLYQPSSYDAKWNEIVAVLTKAMKDPVGPGRTTWYLNYCSAERDASLITPRDVASNINPRLSGQDLTNNTNTLVMDFPDINLILKIINVNRNAEGNNLEVQPLPLAPAGRPTDPPGRPPGHGPSPF
jgi:GH18 family chitinase